jgi:hypothetical protein
MFDERVTSCHRERGLMFVLQREDQPQSKDPYRKEVAGADAGNSGDKSI